VILNLNHYIRVTLTDYGRAIAIKAGAQKSELAGEWQLWSFMATFGSHLEIGFHNQVIVNNRIEYIGDPWMDRVNAQLDRHKLIDEHGEGRAG
jgi:hypothetical protein